MSINPVTWMPTTALSPTGRPWPRGFRNGNGGNIDYSAANKWQGLASPPIEPKPLDGTRPRFCRFTSAVWGLRAVFRTLITYQDKYDLSTIAAIIARWAPGNENNTEAYIASVCKATGRKRDEVLDLQIYEDAMPLARAIVRHELGVPEHFGQAEWYPTEIWDRAADLAGLKRRKPVAVSRDPELVAGGTAATLAGLSAADGLGLVKQYVEPGSAVAQMIGVLAVAAILYLLIRRWRKRKREAA